MQTESQGEKALYGFDGEVGWRVPIFPADGDFDVRVYAGGYYFTNGDVDTIAGPRGRIEARLYDIDFLGLQSRLTAQGVIQWDQPRGTQGWGGLELRIPLGMLTGSAGPKLNPLDRRMVDRVQRDVDIVTEKTQKEKTSEDVIVDELTVSTHTIVFGKHLDVRADGDDFGSTNENCMEWMVEPHHFEVGLEAVDLAAVRIAPHGLFRTHRYAARDQVAAVADDRGLQGRGAGGRPGSARRIRCGRHHAALAAALGADARRQTPSASRLDGSIFQMHFRFPC